MSISAYYNKLIAFQQAQEARLNCWANHLIVLFAFFLPVSMGGRQSTLFLITLIFLLRGRYLDYLKDGLKDKLVQAFALYFVVHVVWLIGTDNFDMAGKVVHDAKYLLYPLLFITLIDKRYIVRMMSAFFLGMLVSELWSYGIFFEILPPHYHDGYMGVASDPTPVFHHTHYGFMLAVTLTLILQRFFYEKDSIVFKVAIAIFFITAGINIFITAGRTGYVLFIVLLFTLFLLVYRTKVVKAVLSAVLLIVVSIILAFNFSATFHQRLYETITSIESLYLRGDYNSSLGMRAAILFHGKELVAENWLFGVGTGDHLDVMRKKIAEKYPQHSAAAEGVQHMHNEYFSAITQFGVVGLFAFLYITYQLIAYRQEERSLKNMQIILAVAVLSFSFIDIFVIGLGTLIMTVTLVAFSFRDYMITNVPAAQFTGTLLAKYVAVASLIELISWVS